MKKHLMLIIPLFLVACDKEKEAEQAYNAIGSEINNFYKECIKSKLPEEKKSISFKELRNNKDAKERQNYIKIEEDCIQTGEQKFIPKYRDFKNKYKDTNFVKKRILNGDRNLR